LRSTQSPLYYGYQNSEDKLPEVLKDLVSKKYLTTKHWRNHARGYHRRFVTKSTFHQSIQSSTYSLAATIDRTEKSDTRSQSELDDICILAPSTNTMWYDRDGMPVLRYSPRMVSHRLSQQIRQELESFIRVHPLRIPDESRPNDTSTDPSEPPRKKPRHRLQSAVDIGPTSRGPTSTRSTITASTVISNIGYRSHSLLRNIVRILSKLASNFHYWPTSINLRSIAFPNSVFLYLTKMRMLYSCGHGHCVTLFVNSLGTDMFLYFPPQSLFSTG
jgi:hypothetical protein